MAFARPGKPRGKCYPQAAAAGFPSVLRRNRYVRKAAVSATAHFWLSQENEADLNISSPFATAAIAGINRMPDGIAATKAKQ
jgi:hypothetical protein